MTAAPESAVRACLARILEAKDLPALSRQIIDAISTLDDDVNSLQRLANVVLREYSLTVSVVRTANSAHYRRAGRPVQSATHAMMMLGAGTVRQLATSLLLFENYQKHSAGLRELMLLSLLTANHAREVAVQLGDLDPGEAHLCGMFRNLGEVLIAAHLPEEYARIHALTHDSGEGAARACSTVLGFQFADLGVEACRQWGMPESVAQGIRARAGATASRMGTVTAFSHDLTNVLYRRDDSRTDPGADLDALLRQYAPRLHLSRDQASEIIAAALTETRELFLNAKVSIDALRLRELSDAAGHALGVPSASAPSDTALDAAEELDQSPLMLRERLLHDLELAADPASGSDVAAVLLLALEAVLRGGPFDRVVACLLNAERTRLRARAGLGVDVDAFLRRFDFPLTVHGGPVVALLTQERPVFLPADRPLSLAELRWTIGSGIGQFGVYPLMVDATVIGCLYCDRIATEPVPDLETRAYVRQVVRSVVQAITARRRGVVSETPPALSAEAKASFVLRALRGEPLASLAEQAQVPTATLILWREAFVAGAMERLGDLT